MANPGESFKNEEFYHNTKTLQPVPLKFSEKLVVTRWLSPRGGGVCGRSKPNTNRYTIGLLFNNVKLFLLIISCRSYLFQVSPGIPPVGGRLNQSVSGYK